MFKFRSQKLQNTEQTVDKKALIFGLMSVFLCGLGFSIIAPVVPYLVHPYAHNDANQAIIVTVLTSVYAACVFLAAPGLGALSDRYGRRPILLICLIGSSVGYIVFGIGGALWVLFVGRIVEGVTGGSISTIFAYFEDIIPNELRTKYFGWVSAVTGVGIAVGPALGGLLAKFGYSVPMYAAAFITLLNVVFGFLYMPESLNKSNRLKKLTLVRLNPFIQLLNILSIKHIKWLLISVFLLSIPNGSLQAVFSQFTIDTFKWEPAIIGLMFSILGIQDILSQGFLMPKLLLKYNDVQIGMIGMVSEIIGYSFMAVSALFSLYPLFIAGIFLFGFGDSIIGPSINGMLSKSVQASEQGRIQGGSQSIQALARIIGPIIGGKIYVSLGHAAPAFMGIILIAAAVFVLNRYKHVVI